MEAVVRDCSVPGVEASQHREAAAEELQGVVRDVGKDPEAVESRDGREVLGVPGVPGLVFPLV